jgi:hypothetical protein
MAAISPAPRRTSPPAWIGTVGIALGTGLGAVACYALSQLLSG